MRPEIFQLEETVRFADTDSAGIVYFGMFATYLDESVINALRIQNIDWDLMKEGGSLLPIVEQKIKFYGPLRAGTKFKVLMAVIKLSRRSFRTEHLVVVEEDGHQKAVAEGYISRVHVHSETFNPIEIKGSLKSALKVHYLPPEAWKEFVDKIPRG